MREKGLIEEEDTLVLSGLQFFIFTPFSSKKILCFCVKMKVN